MVQAEFSSFFFLLFQGILPSTLYIDHGTCGCKDKRSFLCGKENHKCIGEYVTNAAQSREKNDAWRMKPEFKDYV